MPTLTDAPLQSILDEMDARLAYLDRELAPGNRNEPYTRSVLVTERGILLAWREKVSKAAGA